MAKKRRNKKDRFELQLLTADHNATQEGPQRKSWSKHDLLRIKPLTDKQHDMFQSWYQGDNICAHGSAGTGKTFLALYLALDELLERGEQKKILILRSVVPTRDVGHLPGTLEEKSAPYEQPYHDILAELIGRQSTYKNMKEANLIEFATTSYIRGLTWDNTIIIVDEFQNMSAHEINSIMTRVGNNSRIILAGDGTNQCDITKGPESGAQRLLSLIHISEPTRPY